MLSLGLIGDMKRAEEEYERGRAIFGDQWDFGYGVMTLLRLGNKEALSRDEVPEVQRLGPIWAVGREHLKSPKEGLVELQRYYIDENIGSSDFVVMAVFAAYFGDPEFALDAMEKGINIEASGLFHIWYPAMHEVRQLSRFKEFVREIGLVDYWNEFGWPDMCHPLDNGDFECD